MKKSILLLILSMMVLSLCVIQISAFATDGTEAAQTEETVPILMKGSLGVKTTAGEIAGIRVNSVSSGSLADIAGIQESDILVSIGGEKVTTSKKAASAWERYSSGNIIEMVLLRRGNKYTVNITKDNSQKLGLSISKDGISGGALVTEVMPGGAAEKAGIQTGDLICGLKGAAVFNNIGLENKLGDCREGETVELEYIRDGYKYTEDIKLDASDLGISEIYPSSLEVKIGDSVPLFSVQGRGSFNKENAFQWLKSDADFFVGMSSGDKDEELGIRVETIYDENTGIYTSTLYADNIVEGASGTYYCTVSNDNKSNMNTGKVTLKVY